MKKNARENKKFGVQFSYVLDAILVHDKDGNEIENVTDKDKVKYFFDCFENEYNYEYNKKRYPNLTDRIANYLQGLPNCISIAFEDFKIEEIGKSWGYCQTERKTAQFIESWFNCIAFRLIQLKEHFEN